ncbi:uncharacterized protein LOC128725196 [Anopheles nili]|uniref:uncharacterized protein LOC128725196 n=1 Tax=Anopheles nili TaxID=185578 RepID=UPI00237B6363|nr:uncharacterized protein LOC128725196 [Anopheles nili]
MNRLVLAFGIVCLLQGISAEPKPEFGLLIEIPSSDRVATVNTDTDNILREIKNINLYAPTSGATKLTETKTKIGEIQTKIDELGKPIITAYTKLRSAQDGDVDAAFLDLETTIEAAATYIGNAANLHSAFTTIGYNGIADEVMDAFTRLMNGLNEFKSKLTVVKTAIKATVTQAGSNEITVNMVRTNLAPRKMFDLLRAANYLKASLPLVKYIVVTVDENVKEADTFIKDIMTRVGSGVTTEVANFKAELKEATDACKEVVTSRSTTASNTVSALTGAVAGYTGISTATDIGALNSAIESLYTTFTTGSNTKVSELATAFDHIGTALEGFVNSITSQVNVLNNDLVNYLVDVLMGNDEYGRYCYHKYKDLVNGIFDYGFDLSWQCIDKEYSRLMHLKDTFSIIFDLLVFDVEDAESQLGVCNLITTTATMNACVTQMKTYLTALFAETEVKLGLLKSFGVDEAVASENRLLICMQLSNIETSIIYPSKIKANIKLCNDSGPNGTD